ncbi:MAG: hypothetical protein KJO08_06455, partial [Gammaproteobacteria bacterium]|nr:hypothetical protein [Gammaproteobacteria bacterium]
HFPALYRAGFRESLLNPRWLTHGVYQLLYSATLKEAKGVLSWNDVRAILKDRGIEDEQGNRLPYPEDKLDFLIRAMAEFKLCYPSPDASPNAAPNVTNPKWIVPDLLPSDQPEELGFKRTGALRFDFKFESFLPRHVLGMFIVEHYRDIRNNQVWQHGVRLASRRWPGAEALVRADYQSRVLKLAVAGDHVDSYFAILYDSLLGILERMPKLKHTQHLHLDESARIGERRAFPDDEAPTANFATLLAHKVAGQGEFICEFGKYDLQKLLHLLQAKIDEDHPEPKTEGKALEYWRKKLGDVANLITLFTFFSALPR